MRRGEVGSAPHHVLPPLQRDARVVVRVRVAGGDRSLEAVPKLPYVEGPSVREDFAKDLHVHTDLLAVIGTSQRPGQQT